MIYALLTSITLIICLLFVRFVLKQAQNNRYLYWLALAITGAIVWQSSEFVNSYINLSSDLKILIWKIGDIAALWLFLVVFRFLSQYFRVFLSKALNFIMFLAFGVLAVFVFVSDKYLLGVQAHEFLNWTGIAGPVHYLHSLVVLVFAAAVMFLLIRVYIKAAAGKRKQESGLMLAGVSLAIITGLTTDVILPKLQMQVIPLGGIAMVVFIATVITGMYRFQFLDIRLQRFNISQKIIYSFLILIIAYSLFVFYLVNQFGVGYVTRDLASQIMRDSQEIVIQSDQKAENVIGESYARLGAEIAQKIRQFWHRAGEDALYLADLYAQDPDDFAREAALFQIYHNSLLWYNAGSDEQPVPKKELAPLYSEITFIDYQGQEQVKLRQGQASADLRDVSRAENTEFKQEDYFARTLELDAGELYISPLMSRYVSEDEIRSKMGWTAEQEIEWKKVRGRDMMRQGFFRFAAPVIVDGERRGIVVLNLDYRHFADLTRHIDPADEERQLSTGYAGNYILVFDAEGNTLNHPKPSNIRGYLPNGELMHSHTKARPGGIFNLRDYDKNDNYQEIYRRVILEGKNLVQTARDVGGRTKMTISVPVRYEHGGLEYFKGGLMMSVNNDNFFTAAQAFSQSLENLTEQSRQGIENAIEFLFIRFLFWTIVSVTALIILVILILRRAVFEPIRQLKEVTARIGRGDLDTKIHIKSRDEIGDLASAFRNMTQNLKRSQRQALDYQQNLEKAVSEKTAKLRELLADMRQDKDKLEKQRSATLNILEDVSESQAKAAAANQALEKKRMELEAMKQLSDDLSGALDINEVILIFSKYLQSLLKFTTMTFLLVDYSEDQEVIYNTYLKHPVSEDYLEKNADWITEALKAKDNDISRTMLHLVKTVQPHTFGQKIDNNSDKKILAHNVVPLQIADRYLGLLQLTSDSREIFNKETADLIDAMIVTLSLSLDRLNTLILTQHSKTVSLVESLGDGVLMLNHKKNVQLMNDAFSRFTGMSRDYFGIDNLYKLFPDYELEHMVGAALDEGKVAHINEIKLLHKFFEVFVTPVRDNHENIVAVALIFHDITTLKEIDQLKTEFVSVASHQLRTPLTAIKLFTDMLRRQEVGKLNKGQKEYVENVHESTERMLRLVNDLLNVTRIESGRLRIEPQPVDVCELVKSIAGELKPLAEPEGKKIKLEFKNKLKDIPLDQNLIRQVVHNLLANAIRYSQKGKGRVVCTVKKASQNFFEISVKDNGIGIPENVQPRIFEKFYRADNAIKSITEGTGLGLYVSKMIVEVSGGKIWFESAENKGTTFFVHLPMKGMKSKEGERGLAIS